MEAPLGQDAPCRVCPARYDPDDAGAGADIKLCMDLNAAPATRAS